MYKTYAGAHIAEALDLSNTAIYDCEIRFIYRLYKACRKDIRYEEKSNLELLSMIQVHLGASLNVVAQTIKRKNIPI